MIDIAQKFALIRAACVQLRGPDYCSDTVVQALGAIARHETGFSRYKPFFRPAKDDQPEWYAWNFGAMQCGAKADKDGKCPEGCFPARDSSPVTGAYLACFQVHPTEEAGVAAFVRLVAVSRPGIAAVLPSGNVRQIAEAMHQARYYEGHGATVEERIAGYASALLRNAQVNAAQARVELLLHEPPPPPPPPPPTPEEYGLLAALGVAVLAAALRAILPPKTTPGDQP
jgi:hypothetical protein